MLSSMAAEDALFGLWEDAPAGLRLVRYDARGHGCSPAGAGAHDFTWERLGDDMLALDPGPGPVVLGGWSMGCAAAIHAALAAPQRVRALVLMLPPLFWQARVEHAALYRRGAALGERLGQRRMGRLLHQGGNGWPPWLARARPAAVAQAAASIGALSGAAMAPMYAGAAASDLPCARDLAPLAGTPVLLVGWEGDPLHPLASCALLQRLLPRSQLLVLASDTALRAAGHQIAGFAAGLG